jgi:hypothetical protein
MIRLVSGLFSVHAEVARQELGREQGRLFAGLLLLFLGLVCLSMLILLLQGFGIWILMQRGLGLGWALLVMSGIDALIGIVARQETAVEQQKNPCSDDPLRPKTYEGTLADGKLSLRWPGGEQQLSAATC